MRKLFLGIPDPTHQNMVGHYGVLWWGIVGCTYWGQKRGGSNASEVVDMSVVTEANSAKMTLLDKEQVEQAKAMARVKMEFMKRISEEALDTAVIQEGIPLEATIDARDTYMIIRATYCVTSEAEYRKSVREMREEWKAGKPITTPLCMLCQCLLLFLLQLSVH